MNLLTIRKRHSGVAFIMLDTPGKVNFLTGAAIAEFDAAVDKVAHDKDIKALVIISGKADNFVSGADLHEIIKFTDASQGLHLASTGQQVLNKIARLPIPTVAAMNGACLGGGLELALSCDARIATDAGITLIGLPETRLGFIPGLGGTQRLPRLIGAKAAVELILTADTVDAKRAHELGLVDEVCNADDLMAKAEALAAGLAQKGKPAEKNKAAEELTPENLKRFFAMAERSVRIKTKGKYPAQTRALEVMKKGLDEGLEVGLDAEARAFSELSVTDVSRNLVFLFFTTEFYKQSALAAYEKLGGSKISTVGIVGGGTMGTALAQQAALNGFTVLLKTINPDRQKAAVQKVVDAVSRAEMVNKKGAIISAPQYQDLCDADLVIEACAEDEQTKISVLEQLSKNVKEGCIVATNTSSIGVTNLAQHFANQGNFVGLHFFNPVDKMPLVELVSHSTTKRETTARAGGFACQLGKIPAIIKDSPSYLVNRLVSCYLGQAARIALTNVPLNWVEDSAIDFGMPLGPYALADEIGLDVTYDVALFSHKAFGERMAPPAVLLQMLGIGLIGKKTGRGIYSYDANGRKLAFDPHLFDELSCIITEEKASQETKDSLAEQLILPMIDEAARCLEEKVARRPREIDMCVVLGMGFPPFRGGLLRYADTIGAPALIEKLNAMYQKSVWNIEVSSYLKKLAAEGRGFYTRGSAEE
ncbi:MAG TPA: enoyl-CoA hydratase-related protein [Planktothrix sp.]|jgi:3-hydroxyacyl-CoA dehydrogenase/enoyl-CoA hydratase/3-hydroxybutyryl-CoA epimerase